MTPSQTSGGIWPVNRWADAAIESIEYEIQTDDEPIPWRSLPEVFIGVCPQARKRREHPFKFFRGRNPIRVARKLDVLPGVAIDKAVQRVKRRLLVDIAGWLADGQLRPGVQEIYPITRFAEALAVLEAGHVRGKLVVRIGGAETAPEREPEREPG